MVKNENSNTPKAKKGILIKIISAILILFAMLCIMVIIKNSNTGLILGVAGIVLLVVTMNVADALKVNKYNAKAFALISIVLNLVAIIFAFKHVIFSYVLVVPALILSGKCRKCDPKNKLYLISFIMSLLFLFGCLFLSAGGYIKRTNS